MPHPGVTGTRSSRVGRSRRQFTCARPHRRTVTVAAWDEAQGLPPHRTPRAAAAASSTRRSPSTPRPSRRRASGTRRSPPRRCSGPRSRSAATTAPGATSAARSRAPGPSICRRACKGKGDVVFSQELLAGCTPEQIDLLLDGAGRLRGARRGHRPRARRRAGRLEQAVGPRSVARAAPRPRSTAPRPSGRRSATSSASTRRGLAAGCGLDGDPADGRAPAGRAARASISSGTVADVVAEVTRLASAQPGAGRAERRARAQEEEAEAEAGGAA